MMKAIVIFFISFMLIEVTSGRHIHKHHAKIVSDSKDDSPSKDAMLKVSEHVDEKAAKRFFDILTKATNSLSSSNTLGDLVNTVSTLEKEEKEGEKTAEQLFQEVDSADKKIKDTRTYVDLNFQKKSSWNTWG